MVEKDFGIGDARKADLLVHRIASDWTQANLSPTEKALCTFSVKLTNSPQQMHEDDIAAMKATGLSDQSIHDATQVISYFNYINRVADALDVDLEDGVHAWEKSMPTDLS